MDEQAARRAFIFIFCTRVIDAVGFGILMPVMPSLIMEVGQIGLADATRMGGLLLITYSVLQFLFGPMLGGLSDQFGRRPVILFSLAAFAVDYALMAFAPTLLWLFIGRAIAGMAGAVYAPSNAFAADITPPEKRAAVFGRLGAAFGLGFIIGPALGGLVGEIDPRAPFFLAAAMAAANFLFGLFVLPESLPPERRRKLSLARANPLGSLMAIGRHEGVLGLLLVLFLFSLAFNVYPATWAYYTEAKFQWSSFTIGLSLMCTGAFMAIIQFMATAPIIRRFGETLTAQIAIGIAIAGALTYAFLPYGWMVFLIQPLVSPQALTQPALTGLMSRNVDPAEQGSLQGTIGGMMALGSMIGPLMLTQTLGYFTDTGAPFFFPGAAFVLAAGLMALSLLVLTVEMARRRK